MSSDTLISIVLTLIGCFLSSLSLVMMKVAHNNNKQEESVFKLKEWWIGLVNLIAGSVINVVALGYGNQLMLASTSSISIIFNTLLSVFILKETFFRSDAISILLICTGSVLFLAIAKNDETTYTEEELANLYWRPVSLVYISASLLFIVWAYYFDNKIKERARWFQRAIENQTDASS